MVVVPCSLLRTVQARASNQAAITDLHSGRISTCGDLALLAARFRRTLAQLGVESCDTVRCDLGIGSDLAALILACLESGLRLDITPGGASRASTAADSVKLLIVRERVTSPGHRVRHVSVAELGQSAAAWSLPEPASSPVTGTISVESPSGFETMAADALSRSIANFGAAYPSVAGQTLLSASTRLSLEAVIIAMIIPLALGLHVAVAGERVRDTACFDAALKAATWCEFAAHDLLGLLERSAVPAMPATVRAVFCGSGRLRPLEVARAEAAMGRALQRGYGTGQTGFWAVCWPGVDAEEPDPREAGDRYTAGIREMRSPLRLIGAGVACKTGEIVLRTMSADGAETRTGDVGWMTPANTLEVAGKLSDVSVRGGQAILLSDLDRLLAGHPLIEASRTFREHGASPTEPVIAVCATALSETAVRDWLVEQVGPAVTPNRIMTLPISADSLPPVDTLRAVATGRAGQAVVAALTARRFRRNPAYNEAALAGAVDAALLSDGTLNFLMFWGCGPRRTAAAPDRAAVEALGELLAAAEATAPVRARAHVICTDLHATNNGHSESHFLTYFSEIRALSASLDASFELESAVWRRGGLTRAAVSALEQEPAFDARWQEFKLRDRFIHQASRHSGLDDKTAAARHYYATCLLEREVLKSLFGNSVFLTYNGPEFNECFPDLPTLYVYPGPRGRNDKPWFVDVETQAAAE